MASVIIAHFDAFGTISRVSVEKPDNLEAFVEQFEREQGIIDTIYDGETFLYRGAVTPADFA